MSGDRAARRLAAIVESSDDAIASKDLNGIVMSWNAAAERIFGYTAAEMIGASIRTVIPADRQGEEDETLAKIRRGEKIEHYETVRRRKDGTLFPIALTVSPIRDEEGRVVGASKIARDISTLKQAQRERLQLAQQNASITEHINEVGTVVASALDREQIAQAVTDAVTELTTAQFGAFFFSVLNENGEVSTLCTLSGAQREQFGGIPDAAQYRSIRRHVQENPGRPQCRHHVGSALRSKSAPYQGMPEWPLPVRSYLAVPVRTRSGDILGGLFFGHAEADRFTEAHERLAVGDRLVGVGRARKRSAVCQTSRKRAASRTSSSRPCRTSCGRRSTRFSATRGCCAAASSAPEGTPRRSRRSSETPRR